MVSKFPSGDLLLRNLNSAVIIRLAFVSSFWGLIGLLQTNEGKIKYKFRIKCKLLTYAVLLSDSQVLLIVGNLYQEFIILRSKLETVSPFQLYSFIILDFEMSTSPPGVRSRPSKLKSGYVRKFISLFTGIFYLLSFANAKRSLYDVSHS